MSLESCGVISKRSLETNRLGDALWELCFWAHQPSKDQCFTKMDATFPPPSVGSNKTVLGAPPNNSAPAAAPQSFSPVAAPGTSLCRPVISVERALPHSPCRRSLTYLGGFRISIQSDPLHVFFSKHILYSNEVSFLVYQEKIIEDRQAERNLGIVPKHCFHLNVEHFGCGSACVRVVVEKVINPSV